MLTLEFLGTTHVRRATAVLISFIYEAVMWCIIRARLLFKGVFGCIDYCYIFEKLATTFVLVIIQGHVNARFLQYRALVAGQPVQAIDVNSVARLVNHLQCTWLRGVMP